MKTPKAVLELAAQRANGKCEICGDPPDWRGLAPHHKKHKGMGGSNNPAIHSLDNLIFLCAKCHSAQHGITEK